MKAKSKCAGKGLLLVIGCCVAMACGAQEPQPLDKAKLMPALWVKVIRMTAIGADSRRMTLFETPEGVMVPLEDFDGLKVKLDPERLQRSVAYHTLQAELTPSLYATDWTGNPVELARNPAMPTRIPLSGAVLKLEEGVRLLGVRPDWTPLPVDRNRECDDRRHDD